MASEGLEMDILPVARTRRRSSAVCRILVYRLILSQDTRHSQVPNLIPERMALYGQGIISSGYRVKVTGYRRMINSEVETPLLNPVYESDEVECVRVFRSQSRFPRPRRWSVSQPVKSPVSKILYVGTK